MAGDLFDGQALVEIFCNWLESGLGLTHLRNTKAKRRKNVELEAVMYRAVLFRSPMAVIRVYLMDL